MDLKNGHFVYFENRYGKRLKFWVRDSEEKPKKVKLNKEPSVIKELRDLKFWIEKQAMCSYNKFSDKEQMEYVISYETSELIIKEINKRLKEMEGV
jgi:sulfatase maturation enzyme AslB (radical SAM superfamily)